MKTMPRIKLRMLTMMSLLLGLGLVTTGCTHWAVAYDQGHTSVSGSSGYTVVHEHRHSSYRPRPYPPRVIHHRTVIRRPPVVVIRDRHHGYGSGRDWNRGRDWDRGRGRDWDRGSGNGGGRDWDRGRGRGNDRGRGGGRR